MHNYEFEKPTNLFFPFNKIFVFSACSSRYTFIQSTQLLLHLSLESGVKPLGICLFCPHPVLLQDYSWLYIQSSLLTLLYGSFWGPKPGSNVYKIIVLPAVLLLWSHPGPASSWIGQRAENQKIGMKQYSFFQKWRLIQMVKK